MTILVRIAVLLLGFGLITNQSYGQRRPKDKILDRLVFSITMEHQGGKSKKLKPFDEEIKFRSNRMSSKHLGSQSGGGFLLGDYAITKVEETMGETVIHFQAINKNQKGMSLKWEGKVLGNGINGTAIVSKNGKVKQQFVFSGKKKEK